MNENMLQSVQERDVVHMSRFDDMIATMKTVDYREKRQFLEYLLRMAETAKHQFSQEDINSLLSYAFEEVDNMLEAIPAAESYKEKDLIFACENYLLGIVMHLCNSPAKLPQKELLKIKALTELVKRERYIETTLDQIFEQTIITKTDINRVLFWVRQTTDEYQKCMLFLGLVHHQKEISKLDSDAKKALADYSVGEMRRLMELRSEDAFNTLELVADVSKHFADDNVIAALRDLLQLEDNHIRFYVIGTLCAMGLDIPQPVIEALARDLEYANLTYLLLQKKGKTALFPAEYATEEYLAKSDLVRWLTYPTELGKAPDEIVYIGRIKQLFKREIFHVFKFRSDSDTLGNDLKNKWLIGWSSNKGGTFSNFDEFAPFEKEPPKKLLSLIQKS